MKEREDINSAEKNAIIILFLMLLSVIIMFIFAIISYEVYKNSEWNKITDLHHQLCSNLNVDMIYFIDEAEDEAFVLSKDTKYGYATENQLKELQKLYNILNEEQKSKFIIHFSISKTEVEKHLFCQELGIKDYELLKSGLGATLILWNEEENRRATIDELEKIKEFEASH